MATFFIRITASDQSYPCSKYDEDMNCMTNVKSDIINGLAVHTRVR